MSESIKFWIAKGVVEAMFGAAAFIGILALAVVVGIFSVESEKRRKKGR